MAFVAKELPGGQARWCGSAMAFAFHVAPVGLPKGESSWKLGGKGGE